MRIEKLNASIFVVSGSENPNKLSLMEYAKDRKKVYVKSNDRGNFFKSLDKVSFYACSDS